MANPRNKSEKLGQLEHHISRTKAGSPAHEKLSEMHYKMATDKGSTPASKALGKKMGSKKKHLPNIKNQGRPTPTDVLMKRNLGIKGSTY